MTSEPINAPEHSQPIGAALNRRGANRVLPHKGKEFLLFQNKTQAVD